MKIKSILLPLAAVCGVVSADAAPLSPQQALDRVNSSKVKKIAGKIAKDARPVYTSKTASGTAGAYLFSSKDYGFVILSADDIAYPVLGYGDGYFSNEKEISPELKWWLEEYSRQIEWSVNKGETSVPTRSAGDASWTAVQPLLKTLWNQDAPYNNMCPGATTENPPAGSPRAVTGCVATSMAQAMKYFNYPEKGTGGVIYTPSKLGYKLMMRFADQAFDWDNMLNSYNYGSYTDVQADAVAYLMKACGYSVNMNYGLDVSGATGSAIATSMRQYFKYDINTTDRRRLVYTSDEWAAMVYDNLKNIGPVIINGQSPLEGGHSFVCDGYDGKGYFHFNWGWGGIANGYYSLDALNPDAQGIGGAVGGFNFYQNAIFGIQPPKGEQIPNPALMIQYGSLMATLSGKTLSLTTSAYES
ncbi:MAG: C10 family peptidase, partial [Muribaculaceae bacterium]|nr:C10 family peptidase [Muribaculaceae bacterium]